MKKALFVVNPAAGQKKIKASLADILSLFNGEQYETSVYMTRKETSVEDYVAERCKDFDLLVCCGGDGTLNRTVNGLLKSDLSVPIGYIPAGSTNDFAAGLKLPSNPLEAAKRIINGKQHLHDAGFMDGRRNFVYVASFGAFSETSYMTSQSLKNALGHLAYILDGPKALMKIKPIALTCTYDGGNVSGDYIFGAVANSTSMGGVIKLRHPDISFSDGLFEMLLIKAPKNIFELQGIINSLLTYKYDTANVSLIHTSRAEFSFEKPTEWSLDGERYAGEKRAQIEILGQKIPFVY